MLLTLDIRTNGSRNENPDCNSSRFESGLIHNPREGYLVVLSCFIFCLCFKVNGL